MKTFRKAVSGFTIMEIMIVLIIVAVLLTFAYPSYIDYVRKSKRGEAQQLLMNWAVNQEVYRANNPAYATNAQLPFPTHDNYTFTMPVRSATAYTLQAAAKSGNDQNKDTARDGTECKVLNLNSAGVKYSGGDTTKTVCWN